MTSLPVLDSRDPAADEVKAAVRRILEFIGEHPDREGLRETPDRVLRAYYTWFGGYHQHPEDVLKTFEDGSEGYNEMIIQRHIPVWSHCEHHMAPFFGTATIAYIPDGRVVGLSKLKRLVDIFARRLQVQERLTRQICDALNAGLKPRGVGVVLECRHLCMESRGVSTSQTPTITSALTGVLMNQPEARAEFLSLARNGSRV